ncbi:MAG TPA: hypothetical protein VMK12_00880 [Anaeromyxobacteraceae bacterium]|nr:hypothetical protein [Anaeromyxobacteraceae bacterium]
MKVALTPPLAPEIVKGWEVENCPLMGSGSQVWQRTSLPEKLPFPFTVPVNAGGLSELSAQYPCEHENVPVPDEVPAGVVVVPVQS